jgi:hypothetical protein
MEEIFLKLIKEKITPNSYYVLHCIKSGMIPISFINKDLEIKKLKNDGWLNDDLQLTDKSIIFTIEIDGFFNKSKKKTTTTLLGNGFDENIKSYSDIFPSMKLASGKYARSNSKNLENAFRWFFENYNYDWNTILEATKKYVNEYKIMSYQYMRTSQYFIRKQSTDKTYDSDLADYCDMILNKTNDDIIFIKERLL